MPNMAFFARAILLATLLLGQAAAADDPVAWWRFDAEVDGQIPDAVSGQLDELSGKQRFIDAVVGKGMVFDGYTTLVSRAAEHAPTLSGDLTIECWVAIAAYPWNRVPVISHEGHNGKGYSVGIGPRGALSFRASINGVPQEIQTQDFRLPLNEWTHIAARFDIESGLALLINGEQVASRPSPQDPGQRGRTPNYRIESAGNAKLLIGGVRNATRPVDYHRFEGTRPTYFSLEGALDDLKLYASARSNREIAASFASASPADSPFAARLMPSGPPGTAPFGAYLTTLDYHPEWDALWQVGPHADLLVRFDQSPARVVFWRGTQYSPAWVSENNLWMADQSVEGYDEDYTWEHMNDKQNRFSHVRLIEQTDARVVVHWRYAPVDVHGQVLGENSRNHPGAWIDEYYTFFPDATGIRQVSWQRGALPQPIQFQESIPLAHPGQVQGDIVHEDYATVGNLLGETQTLSYVEKPGTSTRSAPDDLVVQMHHFKSDQKPFIIFESGNNMGYLRDMDKRSLRRPGSSSHWPVAQIPSDGRTTQARDRASSFLGFPISEPPIHTGEDGRNFIRSLYGMTNRPFEDVVDLARSWNRPAKAELDSDGFDDLGYNRSERAYRFRRQGGSDLAFELAASRDTPLHNVSIVIEDWGDANAVLQIDGRPVPRGPDFRYGTRRRMASNDLVVWVALRSHAPTRLSIRADAARPLHGEHQE